MKAYDKCRSVYWEWGKGTTSGKVSEVFHGDVTRTIKGTKVKRTASKEDPAYLIEQEDGSEVLKGHSELSLSD